MCAGPTVDQLSKPEWHKMIWPNYLHKDGLTDHNIKVILHKTACTINLTSERMHLITAVNQTTDPVRSPGLMSRGIWFCKRNTQQSSTCNHLSCGATSQIFGFPGHSHHYCTLPVQTHTCLHGPACEESKGFIKLTFPGAHPSWTAGLPVHSQER